MDSLAYSVMLEMKTNTSSLNKDLQKSLTIANDYHKQMSKNFDSSTKAVKGYINAHSGLNKVYKEELSWWDKIGRASGSVLKMMLLLPFQITKSIAGIAVGVVRSITSAVMGAISYVNKYVDQIMGQYDKMIEEYRFANIQAAGGVGLLHDRMTDLMAISGATADEAKKIVGALTNAGFSAKQMGDKFNILTQTLWEFERITGVSSETSAGLAKSLGGLGFNAESTRKMFIGLTKQMYAGRLTTSEMTEVMNNLREEMYSLEFAFDQEAIVKYSNALGDLAGAAKLVGVNVSKATALMSELNRNPLKFVVALGSDAFYKSAGENLETLIGSLDQMRDTLDGVPPGLKPELLQSIYGIDTATFKMLEGMEEFRKKYPEIAKFGKMLADANNSLGKMYEIIHSKVMAAFNKLAARLNTIRVDFLGALTKGIPERIQRLFGSLFDLVNKIFDMGALNDFKGGVEKINRYFGNLIDKATVWVRVFSDGETIKKVATYIKDIYKIFDEQLIPAAINFAKALMRFTYEAIIFIGESLGKLFTYVDDWVENGGPKKLGEKFEWVGGILKWIYENRLMSIGIYLTATMLPAVLSIMASIATAGVAAGGLAPALTAALPIIATIAATVATAYAVYKAYTIWKDEDIQKSKEETAKLNKAKEDGNKALAKAEEYEKSLLGLTKEQALAKTNIAMQENERLQQKHKGDMKKVKELQQQWDFMYAQKMDLGWKDPRWQKGGDLLEKAIKDRGVAREEKGLGNAFEKLVMAGKATAGETDKLRKELKASFNKANKSLDEIDSNTKKPEETPLEKLQKELKQLGSRHTSSIGESLGMIGKKQQGMGGKQDIVTFEDMFRQEMYSMEQRAKWRGEKWDPAAQELSKKELLFRAGKGYELEFFKIFRTIKESALSKEKGWTDEDIINKTKTLLVMGQKGLKESELFKNLEAKQQQKILNAEGIFAGLKEHGGEFFDKYFSQAADINNQYIKKYTDKVAEIEAEKERVIPPKPVSSSEIPPGSASGAKSVHAATSSWDWFDKKGLVVLPDFMKEDSKESVAASKEQVRLLSNIEKKIGNNLYSRNNPSHDEITATTWGN